MFIVLPNFPKNTSLNWKIEKLFSNKMINPHGKKWFTLPNMKHRLRLKRIKILENNKR